MRVEIELNDQAAQGLAQILAKHGLTPQQFIEHVIERESPRIHADARRNRSEARFAELNQAARKLRQCQREIA